MTIDEVKEEYEKVENDEYLQRLISQADSRYILFNTNESRENFPAYNINDSLMNQLALHYLNIGCAFAEGERLDLSIIPFEKGASLLEYIHGSQNNRSEYSNYYGILASLSYYVSFQYSKSFILIKKFENTTKLASIIFLFLKRSYTELLNEINFIVTEETNQDSFISENVTLEEGESKIYLVVISKSLNYFLQYFFTGNIEYLEEAKRTLINLKDIASLQRNPEIWWVIRLLLIISDGIRKNSLWSSLGPYFDLENEKVISYIRSLIYLMPHGVYELFISQRDALPKVFGENSEGCVVSMPTSSGKTRIAELAVLKCLTEHVGSKVLFIAPFKSLSFEIENSLERVLENSDFTVSHLYGGGLYSQFDEQIISESDILIATPEKAKAILRANSEILQTIKLVILDEGHLLGPTPRYISNEIFYEELRYFIKNNNGKFILLSAVLPNPKDLAQWLTESRENVYQNTWRPSDERIGKLIWNGNFVNLDWKSTETGGPTFNNRFIVKQQLPPKPRERVPKYFPGNKFDAIAATALRFNSFGPVLIFVVRKDSVFTMAESYLKSAGISMENFDWKNQSDWKAYELASIESFGPENKWLFYAQKGILCHNADLNFDVRVPLERLMRFDRPHVIIATSTLGQGVNLGISTVIFSDIRHQGKFITTNDFWNIAGRAGRAFKDHEGKILVTLDISDTTARGRFIADENRARIEEYFDKEGIGEVYSGVLILFKELKLFSNTIGIEFDVLIELIAENRLQEIGDDSKEIENSLDWIDDSLLALLESNNQQNDEIDYGWIEDFFQKSLAYIQASEEFGITQGDIVNLLTSRINGIVSKVGDDRDKWRSIIQSGLPLNSNLAVENSLKEIIEGIEEYKESNQNIEDKIILVKYIEDLLKDISLLEKYRNKVEDDKLNEIRVAWITGKNLTELEDIKDVYEIINSYFVYSLAWVLNAIAMKLKNLGLDENGKIIEEISLLVETGLPYLMAIKIYQSGIRSRLASLEIYNNCIDFTWDDLSVRDIRVEIISNKLIYIPMVSPQTAEWIELMSKLNDAKKTSVPEITSFNFASGDKPSDILIAKEINGKQYLISPDLKVIKDVTTDIDFSSINNIHGVYFEYNENENSYQMKSDNPHVRIIRQYGF